MEKRLEGRVAIVTGGGGGIGAAVAKRFIREGAYVAVTDILEDAARQTADALGAKAIAIQFDVTNPESVKAMIDRTVEHFGKLDILHNNAGVSLLPDTTAVEIPFEIWNKTMAINAGGYMLGCKYAIPHMVRNGGGAIINTASGSGELGDLARVAYGASKAAVIALTKYVATQHGHDGIRCNAIAPGVVLTEALDRNAPGLKEIIKRHVLTREFGTPDDIAALVAFLASDESAYITGESIGINGGSMAHQAHYADLRALMTAT